MRWLLVALVSLTAGAAQAQAQNTTTTCRMVYNELQCDTKAQNGYQQAYDAAAQRSAGAGVNLGSTLFPSEQAAQDRLRAMNEQNLMKKLGGYIAEGRCAQARDAALKEGRLDLAKEVTALCPIPATQ